MFTVSFYTAEGTYTLPISSNATSWKKARDEADHLLDRSPEAPLRSMVKDFTIWLYKRGKLYECHTWFFDAYRR